MNERVLIIEDDQAIVKVLERTLRYEGYQVDSAYDGETGLEVARENKPDLVILDWMLPGIDGLFVSWPRRNKKRRPADGGKYDCRVAGSE